MDITWHEFWSALSVSFGAPEQPWLLAGGLLLWVFLRLTLPSGSRYVLQQTLVFSCFACWVD